MAILQASRLYAQSMVDVADGLTDVLLLLGLVGVVMVGWLFTALVIGRIHPFRAELDDDKKKKPPT